MQCLSRKKDRESEISLSFFLFVRLYCSIADTVWGGCFAVGASLPGGEGHSLPCVKGGAERIQWGPRKGLPLWGEEEQRSGRGVVIFTAPMDAQFVTTKTEGLFDGNCTNGAIV